MPGAERGGGWGLWQVTGQALVLVLIFMHGTRERLMEIVEWCLPDRIPLVWPALGLKATPAQMLHAAIISKISDFRASVARREASAQLDKRHVPRFALVLCYASHTVLQQPHCRWSPVRQSLLVKPRRR